jgi:choline monooxygenase
LPFPASISDADVYPLCAHVELGVRGDDAQLDVWKARAKIRDALDEPEAREGEGRRHGEVRSRLGSLELRHDFGDMIQASHDSIMQAPAFVGELHGAADATEDRQAKMIFQRLDLAADGRLRHIQLSGGAREALVARGRLERDDRVGWRQLAAQPLHLADARCKKIIVSITISTVYTRALPPSNRPKTSWSEAVPLDAYLTPSVVERLNRPTGQATGLPPRLYTSPEFFAQEQDYLFERSWVFVGVTDEFSETGMAIPVTVAGKPVVIVRDRHGTLRAFHNVCSHRGTLLVAKRLERRGSLRCPYHSWCYGLDGTLKATPHIGGHNVHSHPDLDTAKHGLRPVRCETWHHLIFVNLSGEGPSLDSVLAPLAARWPIDYARLRLGGVRSFEFKANWKLVIENFLESYHLPSVHPQLNSYSKMTDHYNVFIGPNAYGQASRSFAPDMGAAGGRLPAIPGYPAQLAGQGEYPILFPNLMLGAQATEFFAISCEPVSPGLTRERFYLFFADVAMDDAYAQARTAAVNRWFEVNSEDVDVVEAMQEGRRSTVRAGDLFAPELEACVHAFQRQLVETMLAHRDS